MIQYVEIYTDGSCHTDSRICGWAFMIRYLKGIVPYTSSPSTPTKPTKPTTPTKPTKTVVHEYIRQGTFIDGTNNRAELTAIYEGLKMVTHHQSLAMITQSSYTSNPIAIYTDSQYAQKTITKQFKRHKNNDLFAKIDTHLATLKRYHIDIDIHWIRGHNDHPYNDVVDQAAKRMMNKRLQELQEPQ